MRDVLSVRSAEKPRVYNLLLKAYNNTYCRETAHTLVTLFQFWASWIQISIYLYASGSASESGSFYQKAKKIKKNLDFCCCVTF